jgi:hypothetical protein
MKKTVDKIPFYRLGWNKNMYVFDMYKKNNQQNYF